MCGICGFVGLPPSPDLAAVQAMCEVLEHRGPDGQGEMAIRSRERGRELEGWLGHRRLKIIDLTEAAGQPMANESGDVVLTYNGEVYNFRELRSSLEAAGHRFRSTGDTEVVLRAYEEWGEDFVRQLDGMFALAIWDGPRGRLVLARDRTGKKPLYYTELGGRLAFASEIKALLSAPWIPARADLTKLPEYLTFGYVPHPATFYEGIVQVPPAATVVYDADGVHGPYPYWDALPAPDQVDTGEGTDAVVRLLRDATTSRLVSDVPLGALLSGGIDSSIVVGLMAEAAAEPVHTFSIGFPDEPSFDERPYARRVAEHFGTRHTEFAVKADAVALLGELLWHHDQPFADSSAIPTYLVSGLAREHVTIVLNGDGGDEVFGGYDRFVAAKVSGLLPPRLASLARRGTAVLPRSHGYYSVRRRAERFLERGERPLRDRYQSWIAVMNEDLLWEALTPGLRPPAGAPPVTASMAACYKRAAVAPALDQILYANFKTYLPDDLAVKMDRMSMAHSLEARSPFLDTRLIEHLARHPARAKVGLRRVKPMLRRAFWPLLPEEIWNRRKHGFGIPAGRWFREDLGAMFADEVLAGDARVGDLLDRAVVRRLWDEHQRGERDHGFRFWALLTLEHWLRSVGQPPAASAARRSSVISA